MMEGNNSPRRNLEPLLRDEAGPTGPRMGAYAPPSSSSAAVPPSAHSIRPPIVDGYDLHLTTTDAAGQVVQSYTAAEEDAEEDLPPLPPLVSYCSYVRYGCVFGKWILLAILCNLIAYGICVKGGYFDYNAFLPFDAWMGGLLAGVWMGTAVWLYLCAKVVERDVQIVDHMAQYQQGNLSEDNNNTTVDGSSSSFIPDYEHIYGQVSRRIDTAFTRKSATGGEVGPPPEGTSSLVNLSFAFWSVFFAAAVYLGTGNVMSTTHYMKICSNKGSLPDGNSTNNKNDFSNIQKYSQEVQDWIKAQKDPWGNSMQLNLGDDDYFGQPDGTDVVSEFPNGNANNLGTFATMNDGTIFFAGLLPIAAEAVDDDDPTTSDYKMSDHLVLVESPGNGGPAKYHLDIVNPRMFLPVKTTIQKDGKGHWTASQYCFTAAKDAAERGKKRRSWDMIIRTTPMYCIVTTSGSTFDIQSTLLAWKDKSRQGPQVTAASSSNGDILVAHVGMDDRYTYQEVISLNPSGMTKKSVYHNTLRQEDIIYDDFGWGSRGHENTKCIQDHVQVPSAIAALVVLVLCGLWLILREGVPAGVAPLALALVGLIRSFVGRYDDGVTALLLWAGSIFFHGILCCGDGRVCHLPAWIGRDMYIWALYSWILSFFLMDFFFGMSDGILWSSIAFGISGIILNHPIPHIMGYATCGMGVFHLILAPFLGRRGFDPAFGALMLILGWGMIGAGDVLSRNRRYCRAFCRPISRAGRTMMYGGGSSSAASVTLPAAAVAPSTQTV